MDVDSYSYPPSSSAQSFDGTSTLHEHASHQDQSQIDAVPVDMNAYAQTYYLNHNQPIPIPLKSHEHEQVVFNNVNYTPHAVPGFGPGQLRLNTNIVHNHFQQHTPISYIDSSGSYDAMSQLPTGWAQAYVPSQDGLPAPSSSLSSSLASSPIIKSELSHSSPLGSSNLSSFGSMSSCTDLSSQYNDASESSSPTSSESKFSTDVDTLMRAIQSRTQESQPPRNLNPNIRIVPSSGGPSNRSGKRRYDCTMPDCTKSFYQKTHLEIHMRAHTGVKPFVCKQPGCGQRFSQAGNLRTHERRHTGERPYKCDLCDKTFAQRGNVRAHRSVHTQIKPFTCRLDDCNKRFTQLGNLKSHQNKFHADTIRNLRLRFENLQPGETVSPWEENMWKYFCDLYKHCNKGIKGRGRNRRISESGTAEPVDAGIIKQEQDCESTLGGLGEGSSVLPSPHPDDFSRRSSYTSETSESPAQQGFFDYHNPDRQQQQQHAQQAATYNALPVMGSAPAMTGLCIGVPGQTYTPECMGGFNDADTGFYQIS